MPPTKSKLKKIPQPPVKWDQYMQVAKSASLDTDAVEKAKKELDQAHATYEKTQNMKKSLKNLVAKSKQLAKAVTTVTGHYITLLDANSQPQFKQEQDYTTHKITQDDSYAAYEHAKNLYDNYEIWQRLSSRVLLLRESHANPDQMTSYILQALFLVPTTENNTHKLNNVIKVMRGVSKIRGELQQLTEYAMWEPLLNGDLEIDAYKEEGLYVFTIDDRKYTTKNATYATKIAEMMADCNTKYKHVRDAFKSKQKSDAKKDEPGTKKSEADKKMEEEEVKINEPMNEEFSEQQGNPFNANNLNDNQTKSPKFLDSPPDNDDQSMEEEIEEEQANRDEEDDDNANNQDLLIKALDKTRRAHDDLGANEYENNLSKNKHEKLDRNYGIRHALYKNALANGVYLPKSKSKAITDYSMLMTGHPKFLTILVGQVDLNDKKFEKLLYPVWYCYEMLQRFLYNKFHQILPYEQTPNQEYVDTVLAAFDPDDTLKLRRKTLNLTQVEKQNVILRKDKEVKVRDRQGFRISVKAFEKQYRFIEKTLARMIAYQCKIHDRKHEFKELRNKIEDFERLHDFTNKFAWQSNELKHLFDVVKAYVVDNVDINANILKKIMDKFASENTLEEVLELMKECKSKPFSMYKSKIQKVIAPDEMTKEMANDINFEDIFDVYREDGLNYFQERVGSYGQTPQQKKQFENIKDKLEQKEQDRYNKLKKQIDDAITEAENNRQYLGQFGLDAQTTLEQLRSFETQLQQDKSSAMRRAIDFAFFKVYKKLKKAYSDGRKHDEELVREDILQIKEMTKVQHQKKTVRLYKLEKTPEMAMSVKSKGEFKRRSHDKKKNSQGEGTTTRPNTLIKSDEVADKAPNNKMNIEKVLENIKERTNYITPDNMQRMFEQPATKTETGTNIPTLDRDDSRSEA